MVRTDVEAVVHLCSLFTPGMVERRSGCILNVASTAAFQPIPGQAGYGGVEGLRPLLQPRHPRGAAPPRGDGDRRCARDRWRPGSPRRPASTPTRWRRRCPSCSGCRRPRWPASAWTAWTTTGRWPSPACPTGRRAAAGLAVAPAGPAAARGPAASRPARRLSPRGRGDRTGSGPADWLRDSRVPAGAGRRAATPPGSLVFVVIGRSSHTEGLRLAGVARTAWPFLVGLAAGWVVGPGVAVAGRRWSRPG